jgi:4-amino-4-deoxy-L-arabinose transferase-like glycosyltransferase
VDAAPRESHFSTIILIGVLATSVIVLLITLQGMQYAMPVDEGYYWNYAVAIVDHGIGAFQSLATSYIQDQKHWVFPPPTRIAFITLSSLFVGIFGRSIHSLSYLSLFGYSLFLIATFVFVRKHFNGGLALLVVTSCAFSPLQMAMARRALTDAVTNALVILSIWLFFEVLREASRLKTIVFVGVYSLTLLVKETSALVAVFFVIYFLFRRYVLQQSSSIRQILLAITLPFGIAGFLSIIACGSVESVSKIFSIILTSPASNQFAILAGNGPWFRYLLDYLLLSPWIFLLAVGFFFYTISTRNQPEIIIYWFVYIVVSLFEFDFFTKNVRYAISFDMPLRLFAVLMLTNLVRSFSPERSLPILKAIVLFSALLDYFSFIDIFVVQDIYDPVSFWLLVGHRIIPR